MRYSPPRQFERIVVWVMSMPAGAWTSPINHQPAGASARVDDAVDSLRLGLVVTTARSGTAAGPGASMSARGEVGAGWTASAGAVDVLETCHVTRPTTINAMTPMSNLINTSPPPSAGARPQTCAVATPALAEVALPGDVRSRRGQHRRAHRGHSSRSDRDGRHRQQARGQRATQPLEPAQDLHAHRAGRRSVSRAMSTARSPSSRCRRTDSRHVSGSSSIARDNTVRISRCSDASAGIRLGPRLDSHRIDDSRTIAARASGLVREDPDQPRHEAAAALERVGALDRGEERGLDQVLRRARLGREVQRQRQQLAAVRSNTAASACASPRSRNVANRSSRSGSSTPPPSHEARERH